MAEDASLHSSPSSHHLPFLIFLPSSHFLSIFSLYPNGGGGGGGPIRETHPPPPPRSDSSALCDRGKAGLSRCLYLNTHTHACVRAHKHTLPAPDPACALSSSPLRAAFFWRSGAANDTQLSVLKTGGGTEGGKKRRRRAESKTHPAAAAELLSVLRSGAFLRGECFLLHFGTFLFPGEERRKKEEGLEFT